jgi:hypothetical protein
MAAASRLQLPRRGGGRPSRPWSGRDRVEVEGQSHSERWLRCYPDVQTRALPGCTGSRDEGRLGWPEEDRMLGQAIKVLPAESLARQGAAPSTSEVQPAATPLEHDGEGYALERRVLRAKQQALPAAKGHSDIFCRVCHCVKG